jgi:hypothetical protein
MIPKSMKKPVWLAPTCIMNLTTGIFLLLVYLCPDFAPRLHENMFRRGVYIIMPVISGVSILAPIFCLWYHVWFDQKIAAGEMSNFEAGQLLSKARGCLNPLVSTIDDRSQVEIERQRLEAQRREWEREEAERRRIEAAKK